MPSKTVDRVNVSNILEADQGETIQSNMRVMERLRSSLKNLKERDNLEKTGTRATRRPLQARLTTNAERENNVVNRNECGTGMREGITENLSREPGIKDQEGQGNKAVGTNTVVLPSFVAGSSTGTLDINRRLVRRSSLYKEDYGKRALLPPTDDTGGKSARPRHEEDDTPITIEEEDTVSLVESTPHDRLAQEGL